MRSLVLVNKFEAMIYWLGKEIFVCSHRAPTFEHICSNVHVFVNHPAPSEKEHPRELPLE